MSHLKGGQRNKEDLFLVKGDSKNEYWEIMRKNKPDFIDREGFDLLKFDKEA